MITKYNSGNNAIAEVYQSVQKQLEPKTINTMQLIRWQSISQAIIRETLHKPEHTYSKLKSAFQFHYNRYINITEVPFEGGVRPKPLFLHELRAN